MTQPTFKKFPQINVCHICIRLDQLTKTSSIFDKKLHINLQTFTMKLVIRIFEFIQLSKVSSNWDFLYFKREATYLLIQTNGPMIIPKLGLLICIHFGLFYRVVDLCSISAWFCSAKLHFVMQSSKQENCSFSDIFRYVNRYWA